MNSKTHQYILEQNLNLSTPNQTKLTVKVLSIALTEQNGEITECRLIGQVDFNTYEQIEQHNWFNLNPEVRNTIYGGELNYEKNVEIEVALHPQLVSELLEIISSSKEAADYLYQCSENNNDTPFLHTESWYVFYVKQEIQLPDYLAEESSVLKVGYSTTYAQQAEEAREEREREILEEESNSQGYLFDLVVDFFREKGWDFSELGGQDVLKLNFQGEKYAWDCYAQVKEEYSEFNFYSVCPEIIVKDKIEPVANFINRANYGLPVGNFEINLDTGEVRCKTSIDVAGDMLSFPLINRLVEVNIGLMQIYLPGIMAILKENISPEVAIIQAEKG
jgi:hypothetical protein